MKWLKKNVNLLLSIALVVMTIAVFGPLELYFTNYQEFWFTIGDTLKVVLLIAVIAIVILLTCGLILRGKARDIYAAVLFALGVALYIQGNYANINYGVLDGTDIDWGAYPVYATLDTLGWIFVLCGLLCLFIFKKNIFSSVQKYGALFVIAIQVVTLVTLALTVETEVDKEKTDYLSSEGVYEVSAGENIVIFVLDAFDQTYFERILNEEPEKYSKLLEDFVCFDNAVVAAARTKAAMPAITTGKAYPGNISYVEYIEQAFDEDKLYSTLNQNKFDTRIFAESYCVPQDCNNLIANQVSGGYKVGSYIGLSAKYAQLTLYKYMPHLLKQFFWIYTGDFQNYKETVGAKGYSANDVKFLDDLQNLGLQLSDKSNSFRLYYMMGSHPPYTYNEFGETVSIEETNVIQQSKGALYIVDTYIQQMKELGVYEDATIIIMADHGDANKDYNIENSVHGILLVKEKGSNKDFSISSAPVSYFDLHDTIYEAMGIEKKGSFFDIPLNERERLFYQYSSEQGSFVCTEYLVKTDRSVQKTGNVYRPAEKQGLYKFGTKLIFGVDSTAVQYIKEGVSATDSGNYSWTCSDKFVMEFEFQDFPKKNLEFKYDLSNVYTGAGPQNVIVYANDTLCHIDTLTSGDDLIFVVPKEVVGENKTLQVRIELPDAISPASIYGKGYDQRILSLALNSLTISETDAVAGINIAQLPLDEVLTFIAGSKVFDIVQTGVSTPEKSYTWTNSKYVTIRAKTGELTQNIRCTIDLSSVYNGNQTLVVSSGNEEIYYARITSTKDISFIIPKECVQEGILSLRLELPNAASPAKLGTGTDKRTLALALQSIKFELCDEEYSYEEQTGWYDYKLGTELSFKKEMPTASNYCFSGFSHNENNFTWSSGKQAIMRFNIIGDAKEYMVMLEISAVKNAMQEVTIYANGNCIDTFVYEKGGMKTFIVPREYVADGKMELTFDFPNAISSVDLGTGGDVRKLALAFKTIKISDVEENDIQ